MCGDVTCRTSRTNSGRDLLNNNRLGGEYVGLILKWDYKNREVHLSMLGYVQKALISFNHQQSCKPQHQPQPQLSSNYGKNIQLEDTAPHLNQKQTKYIQEVTMIFLYYTQAINSTMLTALSAIAMEQANQP